MYRFFILLIGIVFCNCSGQESKMNGISFVASPTEINQTHVAPVVALHANWAAVMPFGFIKSLETPAIIFNTDRQWWGERRDGTKRTIELLNEQKVKVMLKPQIWVWRGEFTGNIAMNSEEKWKALENSYETFIITYAKLAEELQVPLLCIGTELHTFVQRRPEFWAQLIQNIKVVYKGKLTYAENWDQFEKVPFWKQLDYIGIDAYFPVADSKTPTIKELKQGWQLHKSKMRAIQASVQKPIVFTEFGYRSVNYTGREPWSVNNVEGQVNLQAQENALIALHEEFWNEKWFAGGFLWKWYHNHQEVGGSQNNRFTIQNKPAEALIRSLYINEN